MALLIVSVSVLQLARRHSKKTSQVNVLYYNLHIGFVGNAIAVVS